MAQWSGQVDLGSLGWGSSVQKCDQGGHPPPGSRALPAICLSVPPFLAASVALLWEQAAEAGLWGDAEPCPPLSPPALAPFPQQTAPGLLGRCISAKRSSLAKQI